jgi:hypothetical protein
MASRSVLLCRATNERKTHQKDTSRNCITVSVMGFGNAVKIALEEVLVRIEVAYQILQRVF